MKPFIRKVIYPKDIQIYTGKSRYTAYRILERVKKELSKGKEDLVTVYEFCKVMKVDEGAMMEVIRVNS